MNPQVTRALKKWLPCTFLSTSWIFLSISCFTGSVETGSGYLPSTGYLSQGAVIINTHLSSVLGMQYPSLPHTH